MLLNTEADRTFSHSTLYNPVNIGRNKSEWMIEKWMKAIEYQARVWDKMFIVFWSYCGNKLVKYLYWVMMGTIVSSD